jgi:hypothetical protein
VARSDRHPRGWVHCDVMCNVARMEREAARPWAHITIGRQGRLVVSRGKVEVGPLEGISGPVARVGDSIGIGRSLVVWPEGTRWDEAAERLHLNSGEDVRLGDLVHAGGGGLRVSTMADRWGMGAAEAVAASGAVIRDDRIIFVNPGWIVEAGPLRSQVEGESPGVV